MIATASMISPADCQLAGQIVSQLAEANRPNLRRLKVDVSAGQITLQGSVGSFHEKQIALQTCRAFPAHRLVDAVNVAFG